MRDRPAWNEAVFHSDLRHHVRHAYSSDGGHLQYYHMDPHDTKGPRG